MYEDEPFQFSVPPRDEPVSRELHKTTEEDIMKFTGVVAERHQLTGTETLAELVTKFKDREGALVGDILPAVRKTIQRNIKEKRVDWLNRLEHIVQQPRLPSELDAVDDAMSALQAAYVCAELDESYTQISPDLFKLHRQVNVIKEGKEYTATLPLFASVLLGSSDPWTYKEQQRKDSYNSVDLSFSVRSPPLTPDVKKKAREMAADFSEAYARSIRLPILGEVLMSDGERFGKGGGLEMNVYWIPKPSELHVKIEEHHRDPDPVLIGKVYGRNYLVAQWDVTGEEPYQHYLEEFKVNADEGQQEEIKF